MNQNILQSVLDVSTTAFLPYLLPFIFIFTVLTFSEQLIDLVYKAVKK